MDSDHPIKRLPVDSLLLDKDNPRLASGNGPVEQFDVLQVLWTEMAVDELVYSIAANGYFQEEPLFVIPDPASRDSAEAKYVVVEGNRRLGAVLILLHDEYREKLKADNLPRISAEDKERLSILPVSVYQDREELWTYLSFRHINGPKVWDSFSKAKYIAQVHEEYKIGLAEIARRIGDRHSTVERIYRGYKVLEYAEKERRFRSEDCARNRFYFSHLYTAIDYPEVQDFLGINAESFSEEQPVPKSHLENLEQLMKWLYGRKSEGIEPLVRKQNPDLGKLVAAISKPESLEELRSDYPLDVAYSTSIGDEARFRQSIVSARQELKQANSTAATGYNGDDGLYRILEDILEITSSLNREMRRKQREASRRSAI